MSSHPQPEARNLTSQSPHKWTRGTPQPTQLFDHRHPTVGAAGSSFPPTDGTAGSTFKPTDSTSGAHGEHKARIAAEAEHQNTIATSGGSNPLDGPGRPTGTAAPSSPNSVHPQHHGRATSSHGGTSAGGSSNPPHSCPQQSHRPSWAKTPGGSAAAAKDGQAGEESG